MNARTGVAGRGFQARPSWPILLILALGVSAPSLASAQSGEDIVNYSSACQNVMTQGGVWYDTTDENFYVSDDYVASLRVSYATQGAFVSALQSFYAWVASTTGKTFTNTNGVLGGTVKAVRMTVLTVTGTACSVEPRRVARRLQPFLNPNGQLTVAGITYFVPLQPDDSGVLMAGGASDELAEDALADYGAPGEDPGGAPSGAEGIAADCGTQVNYHCSSPANNIVSCRVCPFETSHRRAARIEEYSSNSFFYRELGVETRYRRKTGSNCSSSGSWEDWHTNNINNGQLGAWIHTVMYGVDPPALPELRYDVYKYGRRDENDQFDWSAGVPAPELYPDVDGYGAARSRQDGCWFTTDEGNPP